MSINEFQLAAKLILLGRNEVESKTGFFELKYNEPRMNADGHRF